MKKLFAFTFIGLFAAFPVFASFDRNLSNGSKGSDVSELQEFLTDYGCYTGPISGNFFSLTLKAIKCFQIKENIKPTGNFYKATRLRANEILAAQLSDEDKPSVEEELSNPSLLKVDEIPKNSPQNLDFSNPWVTSATPALDWCKNINGNQDVVPDGFTRVGEDCFQKQTQPIQTPTQLIQPIPVAPIPQQPTILQPTPVIVIPPVVKDFTCNYTLSGGNFYCKNTLDKDITIASVNYSGSWTISRIKASILDGVNIENFGNEANINCLDKNYCKGTIFFSTPFVIKSGESKTLFTSGGQIIYYIDNSLYNF